MDLCVACRDYPRPKSLWHPLRSGSAHGKIDGDSRVLWRVAEWTGANGGANMGEIGSRAQLIDASNLDARSHRIAATVPREEVQEALRTEDGSPELVLDIARRNNGDVEAHTLRVAWTEDQLEELLRETSGEQVTLVFDADELQQALIAEEDVEAHGVREKTAAVLTVAAMAAAVGASAGTAAASAPGGSAGSASIEMISDAASSGVAQTPELVSDAASSGVAQAPELVSDAASSGPVSVEVGTGPELISDAASSGPAPIEAAATGPELISDAASSGPVSTAQSAKLAGTASTVGSGDSGLSGSEIVGTAVGGGLVLLITAAGFAVRGRRRPEQLA